MRLKFPCVLGLLVAVFASGDGLGAGLSPKPQLTEVAKLVARGRYPAAIELSRRALVRQPRATAMRALLGIALARTGRLADALPHLEASAGVMAYIEIGGFGAHADALRAAGDGRGAWMVRSQRLTPALQSRARVQTLCQGVDDLLVSGDTVGAMALGRAAVLEDPSSSAAQAFLATALLAADRVEEAEFYHWLSMTGVSRRLARVLVNGAWLAERQGDFVAGFHRFDQLRVMRRTDVRIAAWEAGWLRRVGRAEEGVRRLKSSIWVAQQHPELEAERVRLLRSVGDAEGAERALTRLVRLFPDHPYARALVIGAPAE
jgi:hypothetical protein